MVHQHTQMLHRFLSEYALFLSRLDAQDFTRNQFEQCDLQCLTAGISVVEQQQRLGGTERDENFSHGSPLNDHCLLQPVHLCTVSSDFTPDAHQPTMRIPIGPSA